MFGLENHLSTAQLPKGLHDRWQAPFTARPTAYTRLDVPHCHIRWDERELNQKREEWLSLQCSLKTTKCNT